MDDIVRATIRDTIALYERVSGADSAPILDAAQVIADAMARVVERRLANG